MQCNGCLAAWDRTALEGSSVFRSNKHGISMLSGSVWLIVVIKVDNKKRSVINTGMFIRLLQCVVFTRAVLNESTYRQSTYIYSPTPGC